jgi:regulatory protein
MDGTDRGARGRDRGVAPAPAPEGEAEAFDRALRLLAAHDRTAFDLRRRLERRADAATVERVLVRLRALGYLDDERFAAAFTEREALERGAGARLVRAALRAHGVADEVARREAARAGDAELETARRLAMRGAARLAASDPQTRVRRLAAQLARRGYRPAVVYQAVRDALRRGGGVDEAAEAALERLTEGDDDAGSGEG